MLNIVLVMVVVRVGFVDIIFLGVYVGKDEMLVVRSFF